MDEIVHPKGKLYYTMGEVSEMFDVRPSLLRFWEEEFPVIKPRRNKKGNRLYRPEDVDNIRMIYHLLKERKMKIEVARQYLKEKGSEVNREAEIVERLLAIRAILQEIKQDMVHDGDVVYEDDEVELDTSATKVEKTKVKVESADGVKAFADKVSSGRVPAAETSSGGSVAGVPAVEEEITLSSIAAEKPPFREQVLFEVVPDPVLQGNVDFMIDTFIAKTYDPQADEETPEVDPFAPFAEEQKSAPVPEKEKPTPTIIEQTLF